MKPYIVLSILAGGFFGFMMWVMDASLGYWAILEGILFGLCMLGYFCFYRKRMEKRYAQEEQKFSSLIWMKVNANFDTGKQVYNGNVYLCEDGIRMLSMDTKPAAMEMIPAERLSRCELHGSRLVIQTNDEQVYVLQTAEAEAMMQQMKKRGWIL